MAGHTFRTGKPCCHPSRTQAPSDVLLHPTPHPPAAKAGSARAKATKKAPKQAKRIIMAAPRCLEHGLNLCCEYRSFALLGSKLPPVTLGAHCGQRPGADTRRCTRAANPTALGTLAGLAARLPGKPSTVILASPAIFSRQSVVSLFQCQLCNRRVPFLMLQCPSFSTCSYLPS